MTSKPLLLAVVSSASLSVLAAMTACTSAKGESSCSAYVVPANTDLAAPVVSFKSDVVPILVNSCGVSSSCHGAQRPPVVGSRSSPLDSSVVYGHLVGTPSTELPSMSFVAAGDAAKSFLLHKVDGDQCLFDAQCEGGSCGVSMPEKLDKLMVTDRDTIRRWVSQGAANN